MADQIQARMQAPAQMKMKRLAYIDWMRGLACVLMFQTHCYDSWLSPEARKSSSLIVWSQLGGTLPAPLFVFLAGVSFALVTERLREKGIERNAIAKQTLLRGAEVFGMGLLFRVQELALGYPWSPWTDLLRVDVLNILGLSMMLMGVLCWLTALRSHVNSTALRSHVNSTALRSHVNSTALRSHVNSTASRSPMNLAGDGTVAAARIRTLVAAIFVAAIVAMATPPLWTTHRPKFLPWPIESYINGVHIFGQPQPWLFPLFPWSAFAFAGLAAGFFLFSESAKRREGLMFAALGAAGIIAVALSVFFDSTRIRLYAVYDYWHSNPSFFLLRCGVLLVILFLVYAWCRWGFAQKGFSPIIQLGNTSLLVYWVHIEFVYGRFSILPKKQCSAVQATAGLLTIFLAMLGLSLLRTRLKKRKVRASQPSPAAIAATEGS